MGRRTADDCWSRFALYWGSSVQCTQEGGREGGGGQGVVDALVKCCICICSTGSSLHACKAFGNNL